MVCVGYELLACLFINRLKIYGLCEYHVSCHLYWLKIDVLNLFFLDNVTVASFNFMFSHSY